MADEKIEVPPMGYRAPGEPEPEPEYMTTVGVVHMRDDFDPKTKLYGGWHCTKATDPIVPPGGPARWKLLSTKTHQAEFYDSKAEEPKKYQMCFIALIWTWQRIRFI